MSDREILLEEGNLVLVQQLAATDWGLLPFEELSYLNPNTSDAEIRASLSELVEEGYVEIVTEASTPDDVPSTFYAITETAQVDLEEMGVWDGIGLLYQVYDVVEKTERIAYIREHYPVGPIVKAN